MMNKEEYSKQYPLYQYMREKVKLDKNRLHYHIMPPTGWMNDPNGLCQFKGIYHIYFQYTPFFTGWGTKLWGHYTTKDFISYKEHEPFLFPDCEWDRDGVYSGSAYIHNNQIHFFYTGNVKYNDKKYDYILEGREQNTIHVVSNDGMSLSDKELIFTNSDYPEDMSTHVRDPKIYKKNNMYYMVLGARDRESKGCVLIYSSLDLNKWQYYDRIEAGDKWGYMWECPDLFDLGEDTFLLVCPQGLAQQGHNYQNIYQCGYFPIKIDFDNKSYSLGHFVELDKGFDIYACQTFKDEKGRRILIGWMGIPDAEYTNDATVEYEWIHALTIPRELINKDGYIHQYPISEMKQLRKNHKSYIINDFKSFSTHNSCFEMNIEFYKNSCNMFDLKLREDVTINYQNNIISLELGKCGLGRKRRTAEISHIKNLWIFSDTSSLEIFINDGRLVMSTRLYSDNLSQQVNFTYNKNTLGKIDIYDLKQFDIQTIN